MKRTKSESDLAGSWRLDHKGHKTHPKRNNKTDYPPLVEVQKAQNFSGQKFSHMQI